MKKSTLNSSIAVDGRIKTFCRQVGRPGVNTCNVGQTALRSFVCFVRECTAMGGPVPRAGWPVRVGRDGNLFVCMLASELAAADERCAAEWPIQQPSHGRKPPVKPGGW